MIQRFSLLLFLLLLSNITIFAQNLDDQGNPNNPNENERANACYVESATCSTEWDWVCGWHFIRWQNANSYEMPLTCQILLPPVPAEETIVSGGSVGGTCNDSNFQDFFQTGPVNTSPNGNFISSTNGSCSGTLGVEGTLIQAADLATANTLCTSLITPRGYPITGNALPAGGTYPADYWFCAYAVI